MKDAQWMMIRWCILCISAALRYNDAVSRYISEMTIDDTDDIVMSKKDIKLRTMRSVWNRLVFYKTVSPDWIVHDIYTKNININEIHRVSWTKLRVSAHSLAIEKGRWNRRGRGRLPVQERLCPCALIQTEIHVIGNYPISSQIRLFFTM